MEIENVIEIEVEAQSSAPQGLSAYEIYLQSGGTLSEEEWLESLRGETGPQGLSAYEVYKNSGGVLSEEEWLASLKGKPGEDGKVKFFVVTEFPTENIDEEAIYIIPVENPENENKYKEYIYTNGEWECLGASNVKVDLSDYYTKEEINNTLENLRTQLPYIDKETINIKDLEVGGYVLGPSFRTITGCNGGTYNIGNYASNITMSFILFVMDSWRGYKTGFLFREEEFIHLADVNTSIKPKYIDLRNAAQTITAKKTFNILPESSVAPTSNNQLTNKAYVDSITGSLDDLSTEDKSNIINAINEVMTKCGVPVLDTNVNMKTISSGVYMSGSEYTTLDFANLTSTGTRSLYIPPYSLIVFKNGYENNINQVYQSRVFVIDSYENKIHYLTTENGYGQSSVFTIANFVTTDKTQTIVGEKTFSVSPKIIKTPTENNQLVTKQYVDDAIASSITTVLEGSY